jgi:1-phosphofructokinase family hexose kinase
MLVGRPAAGAAAGRTRVESPLAVLIAGPNLTIDRTLTIDELRPGEVLRFERVVVTPGGKGVNVARVARGLGAPALLVGFTPGRTGQAGAGLLADEGVELEPVPSGGELRSTAVVLERGGRVTVMNEPGPRVTDGEWRRYEAAVAARLDGHRVLVCSGSTPPGAPPAAYGRLTVLAAHAGVLALVDASGPLLGEALASRPDIVAPNLAEAEGLLYGRADETVDAGAADEVRARAAAAASELVRRGARAALVTAAAAGVAVADGATVTWHRAPRVAVRNPIGAGDALVGATAAALERGAPLERAVRAGVAAGAASVETPKAGEIDASRVAALATSAPPPEPALK